MEKKESFKEELELKALEDEKKEQEFEELLHVMKPLTPGTPLRAAIDDIVRAGMGALIVLGDSPEVLNVINGGIKIDSKFTPQQLVELCKMDGAVILSDDLKRIVYCNVQLVPNVDIETNETGTRHRSAERTAKQTGKPVIAISERRKTVTLYYKNMKYVLRSSNEILSKATEALRMLEKHKEILNELLINLNILEFSNFVTLPEVISCIQRMEIISRISRTIQKYIFELGTEGNFVKILLKELTKGLEKEKELILKDYSRNWQFSITALPSLSLEELLEPENILQILLYSSITEPVKPKGYRLLSKTSISLESCDKLVKAFGDLQSLLDTMNLRSGKIAEIIGDKEAKKLMRDMTNLKEQALLGKKI